MLRGLTSARFVACAVSFRRIMPLMETHQTERFECALPRSWRVYVRSLPRRMLSYGAWIRSRQRCDCERPHAAWPDFYREFVAARDSNCRHGVRARRQGRVDRRDSGRRAHRRTGNGVTDVTEIVATEAVTQGDQSSC